MANETNRDDPGEDKPEIAPAAQRRSEAVQRLQVGLFGLGAIVVIVSLASILTNQAKQAEMGAVEDDPASLADANPTPTPTAVSDPLAEAGVVPGMTTEAAPTPTPTATATGNAQAAQP